MTRTRWRRKLLLFCLALAVTSIALLVAGLATLRMSFVEFPMNELKTLDPEVTVRGEIAGDGACTLQSSSTKIVGCFLPGTTFADVRVNGKACSLVVDTGSPITALFPRLAKRAEVPTSKSPIGTWKKNDGQGTTPFHQGCVADLCVGHFTISNVPVVVFGKQHEARLLGIPVYHMDGLLGMDILTKFAVTFVLPDGSVRISKAVPPAAPHAKRIPFRLSQPDNRIIAQAAVNGNPIGDCLVDTGSSSMFVLLEATWKKLELGEAPAKVDVEMGDVHIGNVPANKVDGLGMSMVPMNVLATKGTKTITFDFQAGQIVYE